MSIHILTSDSKIMKQLTQLLVGGQQPFHFHDDLEELITLMPKLKKTDKIFYDLQLEPTMMAFDALLYGGKKTNVVAFEPLKEGSTETNCPSNAKHYFALSGDTRKSGSRLKRLLHQIDASAVKKKRAKKKIAEKKAAEKAAAVVRTMPETVARYLTAKSEPMQALLEQIAKLAKQPRFVFISGEDGADFELAAKEINFRTNGDFSSLYTVDPMRIELEEIKRSVFSEDKTRYCYLGLSYELGALSVARLTEYLEGLSPKEADEPYPCFILGHVDDSDGYLEPEVKTLIKNFKVLAETIEIPPLSERKDDICLIAQTIFTTLRTAHPFLMTRTLSRGGIEYLESQCSEMSYSGLVRTIRNAMSLTERETLTEEELKSFGDDSPTAQHLVESLADEKYFKDQTGTEE